MSIKQVLNALDQLANTLFGGFADETLSARCHREGRKTAVRVIDMLFFFWETDHCKQSYQSEMLRLQLPKGYRK
jgi:hypothetical protein